jgi:DNA adenine methylase
VKKTKNNVKPFLKWAGGKTQLLNQLENYFPEELKGGKIENYYEPFLGGGAVFFNVMQNYKFKNVFLYDINDELIMIYKVVQKNVNELIRELKDIQKEYLNLSEQKRKKFYYDVRSKINGEIPNFEKEKYSKNWVKRSAYLMFLNKTCYNGLFRVNKKGEFNVPFGDYKSPKILDEENLIGVSKLLKNVSIEKREFKESLKKMKPNSFVYLDPPYKPISKTSSFVSYNKNEFGINQQIELAEVFKKLSVKKDIKLLLSNSDPKSKNEKEDFFEKHYKSMNVFINRINANRMINSKAEGRGKIPELVITNYRV